MQEKSVSEAFSRQAESFDALDVQNPILQYMRREVREQALQLLKPGDKILELNAGTGLDAVFFAEKGFGVHATDNATGMINIIKRKTGEKKLSSKITVQQCSFNNLELLFENKFNHIFSNFGGLNCAENIQAVIQQFDSLLLPGGTATLVMMPPFCPWELTLAFKGNFKTAFRRLKKNGTVSHLEGMFFYTYYYTPASVIKFFGKNFSVSSLKSMGLITPPPYLDAFARKYPSLFKMLIMIEKKLHALPPFRSWGDHFILSMKKK